MKNRENVKWIFINIVFGLALCLVILPLLMVAEYNYPTADDWSYGQESYRVIQEGAGLFTVLRTSFQVAAKQYVIWEGRFSNAFLASLQPGIWGEEYYEIVTWMVLGSLIMGEWCLCNKVLNFTHNKNKRYCFPIVASTLIMQILYTPSTVESFYWYTGAVNYTVMFSVSLILMVLFLNLALTDVKGWKRHVTIVSACILAVLVGGNNFSTSLCTLLVMIALSVIFFFYNRRGFWRTWYISLVSGVSFIACILSPGITGRLNANYGGTTQTGILETVWLSLVRAFNIICSWTNWTIVLMICIILPFVLMAVKNIDFDFKLPGIFTLLTFGFYASQIAPNMYVEGTSGGGRVAAILYYSYHIWLVGNLCYWAGWLYRVRFKWPAVIRRGFAGVSSFLRRFLIPYCAVAGMILVTIIYLCDLKEISSYKAYRDWRQGWAWQYAKEWDLRLEVLHDDNIEEVTFAPLSVYPETIVYTDLQKADGYTWVNRACASYYGKESVIVVDPTELQAK